MKRFKRLLYVYQRAMWYANHAQTEAKKPLLWLNETLLLLTFLSVRGIRINLSEVIFIYLGFTLLSILGGKLIVLMGIASYNTKLGNTQNPELTEILEVVRGLKKE